MANFFFVFNDFSPSAVAFDKPHHAPTTPFLTSVTSPFASYRYPLDICSISARFPLHERKTDLKQIGERPDKGRNE